LLIENTQALRARLGAVGTWIGLLGIRLLVGFDFVNAGSMKRLGWNWLEPIHADLPWPVHLVPTGMTWDVVTWMEILLGAALLLGVGTRIAAFGLLAWAMVAIAAWEWPAMWGTAAQLGTGSTLEMGTIVGDPQRSAIYVALLATLMLLGPGRLSLDALIAKTLRTGSTRPFADSIAWGTAMVLLGLPLALLSPWAGLTMAGVGAALLGVRGVLLR